MMAGRVHLTCEVRVNWRGTDCGEPQVATATSAAQSSWARSPGLPARVDTESLQSHHQLVCQLTRAEWGQVGLVLARLASERPLLQGPRTFVTAACGFHGQ